MASKAGNGVPASDPIEQLDLTQKLAFGFSWLLLIAIGLMPVVEASWHRPPSISTPALVAFFVVVGSAIVLRRSYGWIGLVMHIFSQIMIWLSIFVMSLAFALYAIGGWPAAA